MAAIYGSAGPRLQRGPAHHAEAQFAEATQDGPHAHASAKQLHTLDTIRLLTASRAMIPESAAVLARVIESSPVIVLFLSVAVWALWRALREEQQARNEQHEKTIEAVHGMMSAVDRLTTAIKHTQRGP